jgi:hypothetical protein
MRKKFTKVTVFILSLLVFAIVLAAVFLYSFPFQNYMAKRLEHYYSGELHCKIRIGEVKFRFYKFEINDFEIDDQQSDSLLRIKQLTLYPKFSTLFDRTIIIDKIELEGARINLMKHPNVKGINIDFIKKYFKKKNKPKSTIKKPPYEFDVSDLNLIDCSVTWSDKRKKVHPEELDLNYLEFNHLNASLNNMQMIDDSLNCHIHQLNFTEKSGWVVNSLETDMLMCSHEMRFTNLDLITPHSHLKRYLQLTYDDYEDLEEPVDSVVFKGEIRDSKISMEDLAYFNHIIQGLKQEFVVSCDLNGYINNLKVKNIDLHYGNKTVFKGKAKFKGLPDVDETYMDIEAKESFTYYDDLASLLMTKEIPSQVRNMGLISFNGNFNGFLYDFVTYGKFKSEIGSFFSDINMKIPDKGLPSYSGEISLENFDAGRFYETGNILGNVNLHSRIDGSGFKFNDLKASINTDIKSLYFNGYDYKLSTITGLIDHKIFNGDLNISDENIGLGFKGEINFRNKLPKFKFVANVKQAHLKPLNFDTANTVISSLMNIDVEGMSSDLINGVFSFANIEVKRDEKLYNFKNVLFESRNNNRHGILNLKSDIADISIKGNYLLSEIPQAFQSFFNHYLPEYIHPTKKLFNDQFEFTADIKNTKIISELLFPQLTLGRTNIKGKLNNQKQDVSLYIASDLFQWKDIVIKGIKLDTDHDFNDEAIHIKNSIAELHLNDTIVLYNVSTDAHLKTDSISYHLVSYEPRQQYNADLYGSVRFRHDSIDFAWTKSFVMVQGKKFTLMPDSRATTTPNHVELYTFNLKSGDEEISSSGIIGDKIDDQLYVELKDFDLGFINNFAKTVDGGIYGTCSGKLNIHALLARPIVDAELTSFKTIIGKDTLGDLKLTSIYDDDKNQVSIDAHIFSGYLKDVKVKGLVSLKRETELNLKVNIPKVPLKRFEHYAEGLASNFSGTVNGDLTVTGNTKQPIVTGRVFCEDAYFKVDYIGTTYRLNQFFDLHEKYIDLNRFYLFDEFGNTALVSGKVYHQYYDKYVLDVHFDKCDKFQCLKTKKGENDMFYGDAFASGSASFKGSIDDINIEIKARSEKGTKINIPIGTPEEITTADFIRFDINQSQTVKAYKSDSIDLSGIRMNFNFEVTPDAEIQIIFDEALGDVMKGNGNGNLKFEIDTRGQFKMYGQYTIEKGEYLFTALNVFQKKFFIKSGGTIDWNGDPYQAKMNIEASYRVKTSPDNLLTSQGTSGQSGQSPKINVDCNLFMKGLLFSPEIKFGLKFPDIESQSTDNNTFLNAAIKQIENDPEELNRQVFGLMLMKRFLPQQGISNTTNIPTSISSSSLNASVSDLISAQMSNWLSQVAPGWEVNFNYQPGNAATAQNRQLVLGLLKRFLDDRLILEGSYSFDNQNSASNQYNFSGQYIMSKDGRLRIKAFSKNNQNIYNQNVTSYGIGLYYQRQFEYLFPKRRQRLKQIK